MSLFSSLNPSTQRHIQILFLVAVCAVASACQRPERPQPKYDRVVIEEQIKESQDFITILRNHNKQLQISLNHYTKYERQNREDLCSQKANELRYQVAENADILREDASNWINKVDPPDTPLSGSDEITDQGLSTVAFYAERISGTVKRQRQRCSGTEPINGGPYEVAAILETSMNEITPHITKVTRDESGRIGNFRVFLKTLGKPR